MLTTFFRVHRFAPTLIALSLAGCGAKDGGFGGPWVGSCEIATGAFLDADIDLTIELVDLKFQKNGSLANATGDWSTWNGTAQLVDESGTPSTAPVLVARCDSASGCANQGDPYSQAEALFNVKTSETQAQEVIMKGTPVPEDASIYSGICQTRRQGLNVSGSFTLAQD